MFPKPLKDPEDIDSLTPAGAMDRLKYVMEAITLTRQKLEGKVPLIGFVGAPVIWNNNRTFVRDEYIIFFFLCSGRCSAT